MPGGGPDAAGGPPAEHSTHPDFGGRGVGICATMTSPTCTMASNNVRLHGGSSACCRGGTIRASGAEEARAHLLRERPPERGA